MSSGASGEKQRPTILCELSTLCINHVYNFDKGSR